MGFNSATVGYSERAARHSKTHAWVFKVRKAEDLTIRCPHGGLYIAVVSPPQILLFLLQRRDSDWLSVGRYTMASLVGDVAAQSDEPRCVEQPYRDINTTSQMWQYGGSYCTPESAPLTRCTAIRRLHCSTVPPPSPLALFHTPAAIPGEPTPQRDHSASDNLHPVMTLSKVVEGHRDETSSFRFNDEQIDCICDALSQSKDLERLRYFLSRLTEEELQRDSESLYKVDRQHDPLFTY